MKVSNFSFLLGHDDVLHDILVLLLFAYFEFSGQLLVLLSLFGLLFSCGDSNGAVIVIFGLLLGGGGLGLLFCLDGELGSGLLGGLLLFLLLECYLFGDLLVSDLLGDSLLGGFLLVGESLGLQFVLEFLLFFGGLLDLSV